MDLLGQWAMMDSKVEDLVTPTDFEAFARDGVVVIRNAFAEHWLESLAHGVERNIGAPGPDATRYTPEDEPGKFYDDYCNWQRVPEYRDFVFNSPAAAMVGALMRSNEVRLYHEHVLIKEPGTHAVTPWHHDLPYYGVEGTQLCSVWLPLDPIPLSVCPEFVAGSHRWGRRFVPRLFISHDNYAAVQENYEQVPDIDAQRDSYPILAWELALGDCIVFHMLTLHGAPGTTELATRRRGFSTRWLGDDAAFATRPWDTSPPFRDVHLNTGDPMHHASFPLVWKAATVG